MLLGEGVTALLCSGKLLTLFHRSKTEIAGAHIQRRATLFPASILTLCHQTHQRDLPDPVP